MNSRKSSRIILGAVIGTLALIVFALSSDYNFLISILAGIVGLLICYLIFKIPKLNSREIAQHTLVDGRSVNDISYSDVATAGAIGAVSGTIDAGGLLPGVISRSAGQFYPSSQIGIATLREAGSKTAGSLYSEGAEFIAKKINNEIFYSQYFQTSTKFQQSEGRERFFGGGLEGSGGGSGGYCGCGCSYSCGEGCGVYQSCQ